MKLAEALILKADLKRKAGQLLERLKRNIRVRKGQEPVEAPDSLLDELDRVGADLESLVRRVHWTNANLMFDAEHRISDAIAMRWMLDLRIKILQSVIDHIWESDQWLTCTVVTVDTAALQKQLDMLNRKRRDLDAKLQAIRWQEDLLALPPP